MLEFPSVGVAKSVNKHNGLLDVQADWVEASVLFSLDRVSRSDVVDILIENYAYQNQDFANQWVGVIFGELERRFKLLGAGGALIRDGNRIKRQRDWTERPGYAFCLALSILPIYREQIESTLGNNYTKQGELFEKLCAESLRGLNWNVVEVGWSKNSTSSLKDRVQLLSTAIGERSHPAAIKKWTDPEAKDGGLDLVIWKSFPDGWSGRPLCLLQCASGSNWTEKLHTPNLATWNKLVDFSTKPRNGLAMPFAPEADEFRRKANSEQLMLLIDRHRLLIPSQAGPFPSKSLTKELKKWTQKRVDAFPRN